MTAGVGAPGGRHPTWPSVAPAMGGQKATILQSFQPEPGAILEIEVAEGDVVEILDREAPDGWAMVEVDGIEGMVPQAYIRVAKESSGPGGAGEVDRDGYPPRQSDPV